MRNKVVKFLFTLMTVMCVVPSFAQEVEYDFTAPTKTPYTEYEGKPKKLVSPGVSGKVVPGEFVYCLNNEEGTYTSDVPEATPVGNYVVYYKYIPDDESLPETEPEGVKVNITQRGIQVEWGELELPYNKKAQLPTATISELKPIKIAKFAGNGQVHIIKTCLKTE